MTSALELLRRGWRVTLLDPGPIPHAAASSTDVSKVVRSDYGSDEFYHELGEASLDGWHRWNHDWRRPLYHETGFLILSRGLMEPGGFEHESFRVLTERGRRPVRLAQADPALLSRWKPGAYPDGYYNPRAGWAESGAVVAHLFEHALAAGLAHVPATMTGLTSTGSRVDGVLTTRGERISADSVVVAAGAWTPTLLPWLSDRLWPVGQPVLHFQAADPDVFRGPGFPAWAADIANTGWYGFPALDDGRVKVANHGRGLRVEPDERGEVTDAQVAAARDFLRDAIPELAECPLVYQRVCMYCDSFDGDFLIGSDPERAGLVVATGGSGHAFKFAPLLGGMVADVVQGQSNPWSARFAWRERAALRTEEARYSGSSPST